MQQPDHIPRGPCDTPVDRVIDAIVAFRNHGHGRMVEPFDDLLRAIGGAAILNDMLPPVEILRRYTAQSVRQGIGPIVNGGNDRNAQ